MPLPPKLLWTIRTGSDSSVPRVKKKRMRETGVSGCNEKVRNDMREDFTAFSVVQHLLGSGVYQLLR